jgi:hypothetical protein
MTGEQSAFRSVTRPPGIAIGVTPSLRNEVRGDGLTGGPK